MAQKRYRCDEDILCGINTPADMDSLTELEEKHLPVIDAPDKVNRGESFDMAVEVGGHRAHPNEPAHFIEWVEIYCGETFLGRISLSGSMSYPKFTMRLRLSRAHGPIKARAKCNIHGLWEGTKDIEVSS